MKEIRAYIKPHKLQEVALALHKVKGLTGMSIIDIRGFGRGWLQGEPRTRAEDVLDMVPHVKIEMICSDQLVDKVISVIEKTAHTGLRGDGKIYVSSVEMAVRIETAERGDSAV